MPNPHMTKIVNIEVVPRDELATQPPASSLERLAFWATLGGIVALAAAAWAAVLLCVASMLGVL